ncbi:MAG: hypothetical protein KZQ83_04000 [gamma proteobacterium symbiont of Taylorina sp.]|nr:hypothetical protein [gamma proteobacterium symbiont of Taylorina sp.]
MLINIKNLSTLTLLVFILFTKTISASDLDLSYNPATPEYSPNRNMDTGQYSDAFRNMGADGKKNMLESDKKNKKKAEKKGKGNGKGKGKGNGQGKGRHN